MANPRPKLKDELPAQYDRVVERMTSAERAEFDRFLDDALEQAWDLGHMAAEMKFRVE